MAINKMMLVSVLLISCESSMPVPIPATSTTSVTLTVADRFRARCAPCHGNYGKGDGPAASNMSPKPRDFTDTKWQASVTDTNIENTITYGGLAVNKSPMMPSSPDLSQREVQELRAFLRSLARK
jgi:cytochrome c553